MIIMGMEAPDLRIAMCGNWNRAEKLRAYRDSHRTPSIATISEISGSCTDESKFIWRWFRIQGTCTGLFGYLVAID
jgi:hypothetical protein